MANNVLNPKQREELARILEDPTFKEAVRIARAGMESTAGGIPDSNLTVAAAKYHQQAGAKKFFDALESLSEEDKQVSKPKLRQLAKSLDEIKPPIK